jgi:methionyl-tRNA formyltransferase
MPLRVAFAGTPPFAATALTRLHAAGFEVPLVLTQPDRPSGRGLKAQASAVKALAQGLALPLAQPRGLKLDGKYAGDAQAAQALLREAHLDVMVVAAYGLILPAWVLTLPRLGCLNIHASLLPRWRGAAPIQRAIEAGDTRTGITIMQMDEGLDTGAMLRVQALDIRADDSAATLQDRLADLGAHLIVDALEAAMSGGLQRAAQPAQGATYASKLDKAESPIDWDQPAAMIERRVRAFDPFPGASFELQHETVKLWRAACSSLTPGAAPGTVVALQADRLTVACGEGALDLLELQRPGGRRLPARQFLQARAPQLGSVLGAAG